MNFDRDDLETKACEVCGNKTFMWYLSEEDERENVIVCDDCNQEHRIYGEFFEQ